MIKGFVTSLVAVFFMAASGFLLLPDTVSAEDIPRISVEQLNRSLDNEKLVIVDARSGSDWRGSGLKVKGALRGKAGQEDEWAKDLPKDSEIVIYCA